MQIFTTGIQQEPPKKTPPKKKGRKKKLKKWQKPEGMPKRPLSAYNFFFAQQRQELLASVNGQGGSGSKAKEKIGFANLARTVASKWKGLATEDKKPFLDKAAAEQARYKREVEEWQSLGLDPRMKKPEPKPQENLDFSSTTAEQGFAASPDKKLSIAHDRLFAASTSASNTAEALQIVNQIAKSTCWGDFYDPEETMLMAEAKTVYDSQPIYDSSLEPSPIDDLMGVRAGSCGKSSETAKHGHGFVDYKLLSSRLFSELAGKLDSDEVGYLKTAFARSA